MKRLKFQQIILLSRKRKSSNLFNFGLKKNLITASNNSQGKSTLVKSILWTFGCEPLMDAEWKELDCISLIKFTIDEVEHYILRDGSNIFYKSKNNIRRFYKITGEYSEFFANLVNFTVLLPAKKKTDEISITLQTPPPSYYFLPFYIDQDKGWNDTWDDFENLKQYANWKRTIVKAHTGYIGSDYFELSKKIAQLKEYEKESTKQLDEINTTLTVINKYVPSHNFSIESNKFQEIEKEVRVELNELISQQEVLINRISLLQSESHYLNSQLNIASKAIDEIEKDYIFATEYIADEFECPLCGVKHDNSIINRASILDDKSLALKRKSELSNELDLNNNLLSEVDKQLSSMKEKIDAINKKYSFNINSVESLGLLDFVDGLASRSVQNNVESVQASKRANIKEKQAEQKNLTKEQQKLSNRRKQELNDYFKKSLSDIKLKLRVDDLNTSEIKEPIDFQKVKRSSGGSADRKRIFLAYNLAVYNLINFADTEVVAPILIDTPNQQEQAEFNYDSIMKYFNNYMPQDTQIFICAMPNVLLADYEREATVISLDERKLLSIDKFEEHSKIIDSFLGLFN